MRSRRAGVVWLLVTALVGALLVATAGAASAHGAIVGYTVVGGSVHVTAAYDTGRPMAGAEVVVTGPGGTDEAWTTGTTDPQGRFLFQPDPAAPGDWTVEVTQAGHGDSVTVPAADLTPPPPPAAAPAPAGPAAPAAPAAPAPADPQPAPAASAEQLVVEGGLSPLQIGVMIALFVWGAVGTALFFSRRRGPHRGRA